MKERPILFSAPMVRAILDGSKTQTRRLVKPQPTSGEWPLLDIALDMRGNRVGAAVWWMDENDQHNGETLCPYGQPGDRLWVKETHAPAADCWGAWERRMRMDSTGPAPLIHYRADGGDPFVEKWRPSIFMPRWASRIKLEITGVRVQRLQGISKEDAKAEGIDEWIKRGFVDATNGKPWESAVRFDATCPFRGAFGSLWESINGAGAWDANPWVWVVEFKRI
jgi:hypothetical protein